MPRGEKPFLDIAQRLKWHRNLSKMTQTQYAERLGFNREQYKNWESGSYRLSLDGALAIRETFGLSLDFLYLGNADALPMALRQAWMDKPRDMNSR